TVGNYKGGNDHRSVYKTFNTGLNGTPMPSYADVFLFGSDTIADLSSYRDTYSNEEIAALKAYLDSQPTQTEIENMSAKEQEKLVNRRKWSLVHFAKSLSRGKSLFYKLFVEKTDETQ
ncbi:MAG: c-type cytochrome, partial [bacterium]